MKTHTAIINSALIAFLAMAGASVASAGNEPKMANHQSQASLTALDPDTIEGKDVVDSNGQQLGDVDELVHGNTGEKMAVIGLKDSLKEVVIPLDELKMSADGSKLITMLDRADLEALADYDPMDLPSVDD